MHSVHLPFLTFSADQLVIFPRTFAVGTLQKPYTTCTVSRGDYSDSTEPVDPTYTPNQYDARRARGQVYEYLVTKPLKRGPLHVAVCGKQIDIATRHVGCPHFCLRSIISNG